MSLVIVLFLALPGLLSLEVKWSEVTHSCPTLCDPMGCSLPGSSVHGIFQATVLEWIAISFSRGSSQPRVRTRVSRTVDRRFTVWATREVLESVRHDLIVWRGASAFKFYVIHKKSFLNIYFKLTTVIFGKEVRQGGKVHMKKNLCIAQLFLTGILWCVCVLMLKWK